MTFPDLDELLARFVERLDAILGDDLVGVYLTGSFALGGGDAASDCDFLVALARPLSGEQEPELRHLHREILDWPGYWAYNLEGSYAPQADLETLDTLGREWLFVNRGSREAEWSDHCNAVDVRWVLRERPFVVAGADPRGFAAEVPATLLQERARGLLASLLDDLRTWAPPDISWTQRYMVETAARMLFTVERGEVVSKPGALDWVETELPEWRELVEQVRADRLTVAWNEPARPGSIARTVRFVEQAQARSRP